MADIIHKKTNPVIHFIKIFLANLIGIWITYISIYLMAWILFGTADESYLYKKSFITLILILTWIISSFPFYIRFLNERKKANPERVKLLNYKLIIVINGLTLVCSFIIIQIDSSIT